MRRQLQARLRPSDEDGLSLIEVMVALLMLSIVSISAAVVFIGTLRTTTEQSASQRGITVATRALETVQAVPVSQLLLGRSQSAVQALVTSSGMAPLLNQDIVNSENFEASANGASTPVVPLTRTETLDGRTYQVQTAINNCWLSKVRGTCTRDQGTDGVKVLRATVRVTWDNCDRRCSYAASEFLDQQGDPIFKLAQSVPLITTVTPSSIARGSNANITIVGAEYAAGSVVALAAAGGTLSNIVRVDGNTITATWDASSTSGSYTLSVTNPDGGTAVYTLVLTAPPPGPVANNDCSRASTVISGDRYYYSDVRANDTPANAGTITILSGPSGTFLSSANGSIVSNGSPSGVFIGYQSNNTTSGSVTATYRLSVNGVTSNTATVQLKFAGSC